MLAGCLALIACTFTDGNKKIVAGNEQLNSSVTIEVAKIKTIANMLGAYEYETIASARYAAFSKKAMEEGFHEIAILFKAAAKAENVHAGNHLAVLTSMGISVHPVITEVTVKPTGENLKSAIGGEAYIVDKMYPLFLKDARAAGNQSALISLSYAYKTEKKHKIYYENALAALNGNTMKNLPAYIPSVTLAGTSKILSSADVVFP